jgi:hypothetical protein
VEDSSDNASNSSLLLRPRSKSKKRPVKRMQTIEANYRPTGPNLLGKKPRAKSRDGSHETVRTTKSVRCHGYGTKMSLLKGAKCCKTKDDLLPLRNANSSVELGRALKPPRGIIKRKNSKHSVKSPRSARSVKSTRSTRNKSVDGRKLNISDVFASNGTVAEKLI